jgi:hypothetical protein
VAEFVGKSMGSLIRRHEVCPDEYRAKQRCAHMCMVVQRCVRTSAVMFRCTGNVREHTGRCQRCAWRRGKVLGMHMDMQEGSRNAQMCAGRFRDAPEVCGYAGVQGCVGLHGNAGSGLNKQYLSGSHHGRCHLHVPQRHSHFQKDN